MSVHDIATLRFDKRGIGQSASGMTSEADLRIQTYAGDARAWAAELRKRTGLSCVWLIGHSEGALIAELLRVGGRAQAEGVQNTDNRAHVQSSTKLRFQRTDLSRRTETVIPASGIGSGKRHGK